MSYYDPQYKPGAPTEEIGETDSEIISNMKCHICGQNLKPSLWHLPGRRPGDSCRSYIADGHCYKCRVVVSI